MVYPFHLQPHLQYLNHYWVGFEKIGNFYSTHFRVADLLLTLDHGLHPRLLTFKPSGLSLYDVMKTLHAASLPVPLSTLSSQLFTLPQVLLS